MLMLYFGDIIRSNNMYCILAGKFSFRKKFRPYTSINCRVYVEIYKNFLTAQLYRQTESSKKAITRNISHTIFLKFRTRQLGFMNM